MNKKWDIRFLNLAKEVSLWSKDPSTKVGCVITKGKHIKCVGYNGLPGKIKDDERLLDRDFKIATIMHAEDNAICHYNHKLKKCTAYTYPFQPCAKCAGLLIEKGIKRVVTYPCNIDRWENNFKIARSLFKEAGVEYVEITIP